MEGEYTRPSMGRHINVTVAYFLVEFVFGNTCMENENQKSFHHSTYPHTDNAQKFVPPGALLGVYIC